MSGEFCPAYPRPAPGRLSRLMMFFRARRSWLHSLYERSYNMQMGELHLPGLDLYMLNQPSLVRQALVEQAETFPKNALLAEALQPVLGDSLFSANGAAWRRLRAMMDPAFAHARLNVAFPRMLDAAAALRERLDAMPTGVDCDVEVEMTHVAADIIFRTIFSQAMDGEDARRVFAAFARYQELAPRLLMPSLFGLRWLVWPWQRSHSRRAANEIRALLASLATARYKAHLAGEPAAQQDILQSFLEARDPDTGAPFDFESLIDQLATLFLAGHETSASALTWALYLLANSPQVQERAHQEVLTVLGDHEPTPSDMKKLTLVWNVFRETLRLFPPVGFIARESAQSCPMRDKVIPPGASVMISPWLIQRHRTLWADPDSFDPDRYAGEQSRESLRNAYLPFGMGPRVCIGAAFAQQEGALILATVLRHYRLRPVAGHQPEPVGRFTIRSANGVRLLLERRG